MKGKYNPRLGLLRFCYYSDSELFFSNTSKKGPLANYREGFLPDPPTGSILECIY